MAKKGHQPPKRRHTIKDVAADADVSISTVSLALNGTGYVAADTLKRVQASVERLGYVARPAARQLASKKTGNIGFVLRADHFARSEPFYTHVFLGTEFEAERFDRYVLLATIPEGYTPGVDAPRFLRERNIDGIIIAGKVADAFVSEAEAAGVPIVLVDYEANEHPAVVIDNQAGAREAVQHLLELGHRNIAIVGADMDHPAIRARLDGFQLATATANISVPPEYFVTETRGNPNLEAGQSLGRRLLALSPRPTAVFCVNDAMALGVMDVMARANVSVPDDMSVVGFDDVLGAANARPQLTTVRVFKAQLGELAVRYLDELITSDAKASPRARSHDLKVPVELVVRASTGPAPEGGASS